MICYQRVQHHTIPYLRAKYLRDRQPSVLMTDSLANKWLELHGGIRAETRIRSAIHLDLSWSACIRGNSAEDITADALLT